LVPATFVKQLKAMCDGDSIRVGNLATRRDFVDVRDVVWALDRLLAGGKPGGAYNVASGTSTSIRDVLNDLLRISGLRNIAVEEEAARVRRNDVPDVFADITAITEGVGWRPQIPLRDSLQAMWNED
jgi:GDP-4-dehydro-6-deoxy-D-mannose reductase